MRFWLEIKEGKFGIGTTVLAYRNDVGIGLNAYDIEIGWHNTQDQDRWRRFDWLCEPRKSVAEFSFPGCFLENLTGCKYKVGALILCDIQFTEDDEIFRIKELAHYLWC